MAGDGNIQNLILYFVLLFLYPKPCYLQCSYSTGWSSCIAISKECVCGSYSDHGTALYCERTKSTDFPNFSYYNPDVESVYVLGEYISVYDNSFYLLVDMTNASVCLTSSRGKPTDLTTYSDTFRTVKENGIKSLFFTFYNPVNLATMSNSRSLQTLWITYAGMTLIPDLIPFTSLTTVTFSYNNISRVAPNTFYFDKLSEVNLGHNVITTIQSNAFNGLSLKTIIVGNNNISSIEAKAFSGASISSVDISFNHVQTLMANQFNLGSLKSINAQNNNISYVDDNFSKWLYLSPNNTINLLNNGPFPCDYTINWMATYVACTPQQIKIGKNTLCQSGEVMLEYLIPNANCGHYV